MMFVIIEAIAAVSKLCKDGARVVELCQEGDDIVFEWVFAHFGISGYLEGWFQAIEICAADCILKQGNPCWCNQFILCCRQVLDS